MSTHLAAACLILAQAPPRLPDLVFHPAQGIPTEARAGLGAIIDKEDSGAIPLDGAQLYDGQPSLRVMASGFSVDGWRAAFRGIGGATFNLERHWERGSVEVAVKGIRGGEEVRLAFEDGVRGTIFGAPFVVPSQDWQIVQIPLRSIIRDPGSFSLFQTRRIIFSSRRDATFWIGSFRILSPDPEPPSPPIKVNGWGWDPEAAKRVVVSGWPGSLAPGRFRVLDESGRQAFSGSLRLAAEEDSLTGETVWQGDLSGFAREGTWRIEVPGVGTSFPFTIARGRTRLLARRALASLAALKVREGRWEGSPEESLRAASWLVAGLEALGGQLGPELEAEARHGLEAALSGAASGPEELKGAVLRAGARVFATRDPDLAARCRAAAESLPAPSTQEEPSLAWLEEARGARRQELLRQLAQARKARMTQPRLWGIWLEKPEDFQRGSAAAALAGPLQLALAARALGAGSSSDKTELQRALDWVLGANPLARGYVEDGKDGSVKRPAWPHPWPHPPFLLVGGPAWDEGRFSSRFAPRRHADASTDPGVNGISPEWQAILVVAAGLAGQ